MQASSTSSLVGTRLRSLTLDPSVAPTFDATEVVAPATYEIRASDEPYGLHVSSSEIEAEQSKQNPPNWSEEQAYSDDRGGGGYEDCTYPRKEQTTQKVH